MSLINTLLLIVLAIAGVGDAGGNNIWDDWGETLKIKTLERFETDANGAQGSYNQLSQQPDFVVENERGGLLGFLDDLLSLGDMLIYLATLLGVAFVSASGLSLMLTAGSTGSIILLLTTLPLFSFSTYLIIRLLFTEGRTG